ncbi:MAG: hypothetical protein AB7U20_14715 [Planctomycetaceae bacterium]
MSATGIIAIVIAAAVIGSAGGELRTTALLSAWYWTLTAALFWLATGIGTGISSGSSSLGELLWFATALLSLCPPIAVLGARRPGAGPWTWFVLIPLLAVLGWPALTVWSPGTPLRAPQWEGPQLIGCGLVLCMGAGNYMGTKFWPSACLYAAAVCLMVAPLSSPAPDWLSPRAGRTVAACLIGSAAVLAYWTRSFGPQNDPALDRLWRGYRNTFGIVWARRLQDRLNAAAQQQQWPVRATPTGFDWDADVPPEIRLETTAQIEQSLRWMLRRFVTVEWIDQRLGGTRSR